MFKGNVSIKTITDDLPKLEKSLKDLQQRQVLVGVPESTTDDRPPEDKINNAELVYIHTHGSVLRRIPARPIIEAALEDEYNQQKLEPLLGKVLRAALAGNETEIDSAMTSLGMEAQNIVRDWFTNPRNNWAPNSPRTIAKKGSDKPLIDTGDMRKSIIYVIAGKE